MIPQHAIMTSERAHVGDPRVRRPDRVTEAQVREIGEEALIADLEAKPVRNSAADLPPVAADTAPLAYFARTS